MLNNSKSIFLTSNKSSSRMRTRTAKPRTLTHALTCLFCFCATHAAIFFAIWRAGIQSCLIEGIRIMSNISSMIRFRVGWILTVLDGSSCCKVGIRAWWFPAAMLIAARQLCMHVCMRVLGSWVQTCVNVCLEMEYGGFNRRA